MNDFTELFRDYISAYKTTSRYQDEKKLEIILGKTEFEEKLDEMWKIYQSGVVAQIVEYQSQVDMIKNTGLKVLRNSKGKHKIKY